MEKIIEAEMCGSFIEFDEQTIEKNPGLNFGDGKCPAHRYVVSPDYRCPENCRFFTEYTGGNE